jgi:hypothetical protein
MSRAFVKEVEDLPSTLPDRPISKHRNFVTPEGLAKIEKELFAFETAYQQATINEDVHGAAKVLREIRYWRARRSSAEVV